MKSNVINFVIIICQGIWTNDSSSTFKFKFWDKLILVICSLAIPILFNCKCVNELKYSKEIIEEKLMYL